MIGYIDKENLDDYHEKEAIERNIAEIFDDIRNDYAEIPLFSIRFSLTPGFKSFSILKELFHIELALSFIFINYWYKICTISLTLIKPFNFVALILLLFGCIML